jgi:hypothetical protein
MYIITLKEDCSYFKKGDIIFTHGEKNEKREKVKDFLCFIRANHDIGIKIADVDIKKETRIPILKCPSCEKDGMAFFCGNRKTDKLSAYKTAYLFCECGNLITLGNTEL